MVPLAVHLSCDTAHSYPHVPGDLRGRRDAAEWARWPVCRWLARVDRPRHRGERVRAQAAAALAVVAAVATLCPAARATEPRSLVGALAPPPFGLVLSGEAGMIFV